MRPHTSRAVFVGVASSWGTTPTALERASRPLKEAGLWPTGYPGRGPAGAGVGSSHLAALLLSQAGDQPSDSFDVYRALSLLPAENGNRLQEPGFAGKVAPLHGSTLAVWLEALIDKFSRTHYGVLDAIETNLEEAGWTLSLSLHPASAFISWNTIAKAHRIDFLPLQAELLGQPAPRQIAKVTIIPFRAIASAARLLANSIGSRSAAVPVSRSDPTALADAAPENENAAQPGRVEAAKSSSNKALTTESDRSALLQSRIYPTSRIGRKPRDSDSVVRPKSKEPDRAHPLAISP